MLPDLRGVTRGIKFLPLIFWFFGGAQWALERVALLWPIAMALNHGAVAGVVLIAAGLYQWMPAGHHLDGPHSAGGVELQGVCTSRKALANQFPTQPILAQHHHARVHHSIPVAMLTSSALPASQCFQHRRRPARRRHDPWQRRPGGRTQRPPCSESRSICLSAVPKDAHH